MTFLLGFDTGGTYTDAVLYDEDAATVVASAKALTTRHDLSIGLREALCGLPESQVAETRLVSVSTTLATNAMVEAHAAPAGLILIGQSEKALTRAGLGQLLGDDPVAFVAGGHKGSGAEVAPLDVAAAEAAIRDMADKVDGFAVAGEFSVRNPAHEVRVRDMVREIAGLPVTCSHELTSNLDAPRRALTALINARLIPLLDGLIRAVQAMMAERGIDAPLMVVRGDGSLLSAETALERPVETILSGPAASVVGASFLAGVEDGVVSDMGGTTTDVVLVHGGRPSVNRQGAVVGGWRTMVEAVDVRTSGLGGDSEVRLTGGRMRLGPRRAVPLSLLARQHPGVLAILREHLERPYPTLHDGRFAVLVRDVAEPPPAENRRRPPTRTVILERLRQGPVALHEIAPLGMGESVLERLVEQGRVLIAAFTPSDAAHVLGRQATWNAEAARLGATLLARRAGETAGLAHLDGPEAVSAHIIERTVVESARAVTAAVLGEHYGVEIDDGAATAFLLEDAFRAPSAREPDAMLGVGLTLGRPLMAIGAPAATYYGGEDGVAARLGCPLAPLPHADVANAVGAVVGSVRSIARAVITEPVGGCFRVHTDDGTADFPGLEPAAAHAEAIVRGQAEARAREQGAGAVTVATRRDDDIVEIAGGATVFVETRIAATAVGRPDLDRPGLDRP